MSIGKNSHSSVGGDEGDWGLMSSEILARALGRER